MAGCKPGNGQPRDWGLVVVIAALAFLVVISLIWQVTDFIASGRLDTLIPWQTAVAALVGFTGLIITTGLGFFFSTRAREHQAELDRKRDAELRKQEARNLADALLGELIAAMGSCRAFVRVAKSEVGKTYQKSWLDEEFDTTDLAPRIMSVVFEGNVTKLGLLGSPLVREVVVIYEALRNYDRLARIEQVMSRGKAINIRHERADHLEKYDNNDIAGAIQILEAFAIGGYEAAIPVGIRETEEREKRHAQLGKELGIPASPAAPE